MPGKSGEADDGALAVEDVDGSDVKMASMMADGYPDSI